MGKAPGFVQLLHERGGRWYAVPAGLHPTASAELWVLASDRAVTLGLTPSPLTDISRLVAGLRDVLTCAAFCSVQGTCGKLLPLFQYGFEKVYSIPAINEEHNMSQTERSKSLC